MYTIKYKKQIITIAKYYVDYKNGYKQMWGFQINGSNVEDYQTLKRTSIEGAKEIIDHPKREELYGHGITFNK